MPSRHATPRTPPGALRATDISPIYRRITTDMSFTRNFTDTPFRGVFFVATGPAFGLANTRGAAPMVHSMTVWQHKDIYIFIHMTLVVWYS